MDCAHAAVRTELRLILSNALLLPPFSAQGRQSLFAIKPCPPLHRLRERMSRRKQDNPMQLKRTLTGAAADEDMDPDPLEADEAPQHDLIQCGDCHTSFALADIVKFIAHKRSCYKGQQVPLVVSSNEDDDKDESAAEVTSIDTTILETEPIVRTEKPRILTPFRRKSLHDLSTAGDVRPLAKETQTDQLRDEVPNEPLICSTCKGSFYSAAELLRHVQEDHGLHIYQAESKDDPEAEMEEPSVVKEIVEENEEESKDSTTVERSPRESNPEEQAETPSEGHRDDVKSFPEPDAAESQVSSSHPHEPSHVPHSQHMPLISDNSQLPIYIRHPLGGADRYQLGNSDRYFPVPLSQPFHMDFNMPPNHQPSEAVPGMSSPYEGSAHVPFSSASSHSSQVDESAAHRLRLIADVATPRDQMGFSSYSRPYRTSFPPKLKSCEFCGKPFKFQSNLIVHRRSHTGEKPYKCSLCDHACSQASKLKRHMKTHKNVNKDHTGSAEKTPNGRESGSGDGKHVDDDCASSGKNSSNNSTVDEDEEEIELEEEDEVPPQNEENRNTNSPREEHSSSSSRGSSQQPSNSLLCEVMKKTGLSEIQQYKDAYRQAMAEQNITVSPTQLYGCTVSSLLSGKPEMNGPLAACSSRLTPTSSPSPSRQKTPLPSPGQKTLPLPPSIPSHPFESSPPPLEVDRDCPKRFKLEPTSPPSARTPPRAPIWTSLNLPHHQNFFAPVLSMNSSLQHHPPVLPSPVHHNGSLNILPANRRFYPRSSEPPVAPSVLPSFHNPHRSRRGGIANRRSDECEFCGKVFKNCSNLTVHRRSHTGEKPYKCELCSYACAQSSKLTRHMKTHGKGAKEVFKCEVCGMPFSVYSTLEKHMKKEHWGSIKGPAPRPDTSIGGRSHSYKPLPK